MTMDPSCYRTCPTPATCLRGCQLAEARIKADTRASLVAALLAGNKAAWDSLFDTLEDMRTT